MDLRRSNSLLFVSLSCPILHSRSPIHIMFSLQTFYFNRSVLSLSLSGEMHKFCVSFIRNVEHKIGRALNSERERETIWAPTHTRSWKYKWVRARTRLHFVGINNITHIIWFISVYNFVSIQQCILLNWCGNHTQSGVPRKSESGALRQHGNNFEWQTMKNGEKYVLPSSCQCVCVLLLQPFNQIYWIKCLNTTYHKIDVIFMRFSHSSSAAACP